MDLKYKGVTLPAGYYPAVKSPFDVRQVMRDTIERNAINDTYPGMVVTTLGAPNALGEFSDMKIWRLIKDIDVGQNPVDADWIDITGVDNSAFGGNFKGTFAINQAGAYTPALNTAPVRSVLKAGDYYIVVVSGGLTSTLVPALDGITTVQSNDTIWYNGTSFLKYENTNPTVIAPLFNINQTNDFNQAVIGLIRTEGIKQWAAKTYVVGEVVFNRYNVNSVTYTDTWYANAVMAQAGSALPTANTGNSSWWLLGSTNAAMIGGIPVGNDTVGRPAVVSAPTTRTLGVYLSPEEIDGRITEFGGGGGGLGNGPIQGGNAGTFLGPGINDLPAN